MIQRILKNCGRFGLALFFLNNGWANGAQELDATRVRLLPGSPFFERQELHQRYSVYWKMRGIPNSEMKVDAMKNRVQ